MRRFKHNNTRHARFLLRSLKEDVAARLNEAQPTTFANVSRPARRADVAEGLPSGGRVSPSSGEAMLRAPV